MTTPRNLDYLYERHPIGPFNPFEQTRAQYDEAVEIERLRGCVNDLKSWRQVRDALQDRHDAILAGISRMQKHATDAAEAQAAVTAERKSAVGRMLAQFGLAKDAPPAEPSVDPAALRARADAEAHAAAVAEDAILVANEQLGVVSRQIQAVEDEFDRVVAPEIEHLATRLGQTYIKELGALRRTYSRLMAVGSVVNDWRHPWPAVPEKAIRFPQPPTLSTAAEDRFVFTVTAEDRAFWADVVRQLRANPKADIVGVNPNSERI
jgi:hypothetical protein